MECTDAVVVVTGASGGIGAAVTDALVAAGARVVAAGRDVAALESLVRRHGPGKVRAQPGDVADPSHAQQLVDAALCEFGRLDAVVANAGIGFSGGFADMPVERIGAIVDVDVRAPLLLARAALPVLVQQHCGALVFLSSIAGAVPVPRETAYSLAKHAVEAFADGLRTELRGSGVTVSVIRPGVVRTGFFDHRGEPYDRRVPRPIDPAVVAEAVVAAIVTGRPRTTVPRWLALPAALRERAPGLYNRLARH